jgi:hypothetical protein
MGGVGGGGLVVFAAAGVSVAVLLGLAVRHGGELVITAARWYWRHPRAKAALAVAAAWWWRLVALTPPGRLHERHVRRHLGVARKHPEHVTRPPSRKNARRLDALQAEAWPDGEWTEVIRMHLEGQ